jgi:amino acid transporter
MRLVIRHYRFLVLFSGIMGCCFTALAEGSPNIDASDIALLLLIVAGVYFLGNLIIAQLVFRLGNRWSPQPRRRIWGTYGMSLLGCIIGFASLRNGRTDDGGVIVQVVLSALLFALAGYAMSGKRISRDDNQDRH